MKAIVLAGGFAKRLWPMTKENAKPLIDVGGKPVINYIIEELLKLKKRKVIDEIFVSTNKKFEPDFQEWLEKYKFGIKLVIEETTHEGEKLGAIGGIQFLIEKEGIAQNFKLQTQDFFFSATRSEANPEEKDQH